MKISTSRVRIFHSTRAFSLVELLVVIGVIILLLAILLVSLRSVLETSRATKTMGIMADFGGGCDTFHLEHGRYPGIVPEQILATHNHDIIHGTSGTTISSTENAILDLMGGGIAKDQVTDDAWNQLNSAGGWEVRSFTRVSGPPYVVKVNKNFIGAGPTINKKNYSAYIGGSAVEVTDNGFEQWGAVSQGGGDDSSRAVPPNALPDLMDGWGRPILYLRQAQTFGKLVGDAHPYTERPQFYVDTLWPYTRSPSQTWRDPCNGGMGGSLINSNYHTGDGSGIDPSIERRMLAAVVRSPGSGADPTDILVPGEARSAYVLISAGDDGIYFASNDGPGSDTGHIASSCGDGIAINDFLKMTPNVLDEFDDVRYYGGSQ